MMYNLVEISFFFCKRNLYFAWTKKQLWLNNLHRSTFICIFQISTTVTLILAKTVQLVPME